MKAIVLPVSLSDKPYLVDLGDYPLHSYYSIIDCRCIDIVELFENDDVTIDCVIDDEGLLNESPLNQYWVRAYKKGLVYNPLCGVSVINMTNVDDGDVTELDLNLVKEVLVKHYGFSQEELSHL